MLRVIDNDFESDHLIVTGVPGSGKTTVSIFRLLRLLNQNKPVVLLTYQRMLKVSIENLLSTQKVNRPWSVVNTVHSWFYLEGNNELLGFSDQHNKLNAQEIKSALMAGKATSNTEVILDEAQDLEERIFEGFKYFFKKITVGADDDQQMRSDSGSNTNTIKRYLSDYEDFTLQFNYRNTYQIYNFARQFVPESPKANDKDTLDGLRRYKNNGELPIVEELNSDDNVLNRITAIINDNKGANIAILVPYTSLVNDFYRKVSGKGIECTKYHSGMPRNEKETAEKNLKNVLITTFTSAKGMEFDIVILPDFQLVKPVVETKRQAYVACTRTRDKLYLFYQGGIPAILASFDSDTYDDGSWGSSNSGSAQSSQSEEYMSGGDSDDLPF